MGHEGVIAIFCNYWPSARHITSRHDIHAAVWLCYVLLFARCSTVSLDSARASHGTRVWHTPRKSSQRAHHTACRHNIHSTVWLCYIVLYTQCSTVSLASPRTPRKTHTVFYASCWTVTAAWARSSQTTRVWLTHPHEMYCIYGDYVCACQIWGCNNIYALALDIFCRLFLYSYIKPIVSFIYRIATIWLCYVILYARCSTVSSASQKTVFFNLCR
jgi:hypothetical protein